MTRQVITVAASETLTAALLHFLQKPIKRLVVVAADAPQTPVGMLTPFDIVQVLGESGTPLEFKATADEQIIEAVKAQAATPHAAS